MTEILERKLTGGILGFRNGTKTKKEVEALLDLMEKTNQGMYEDYKKKFDAAVLEKEKNK